MASDKERILLAVGQLAVVFRVNADQMYLRAYCEALEGLSAQDVVPACKNVAQTWTDTWPPPPGVVRAEANRLGLKRLTRESQDRLKLAMSQARRLTDGEREQIKRALNPMPGGK